MDVGQLRTFLTVLEHGSFSRAAEALRLGQSTVSFHIKALETAAGVTLLDRRGGGVRPTPTGRVLRRYAQRIVSLRDEALARLSAEESGQTGRLVIAASTIPGEVLLPAFLARFLEDHPRVAVTVEVSDSRRALARLLAHECDLALVGARSRDRRVVYTAFAADEVILVGRADDPATPRRCSARDLHRLRLIVREEGSGTREAASAFLARHPPENGDPLPRLEVGSTEAAKRCVLQGVGLALLSRHAVVEELAAGRLVAVPAPGLPVRRQFHVARLRAATLSTAARELLTLLLQKTR
jgi:DNA-binding transcriptional LysR family regulator